MTQTSGLHFDWEIPDCDKDEAFRDVSTDTGLSRKDQAFCAGIYQYAVASK